MVSPWGIKNLGTKKKQHHVIFIFLKLHCHAVLLFLVTFSTFYFLSFLIQYGIYLHILSPAFFNFSSFWIQRQYSGFGNWLILMVEYITIIKRTDNKHTHTDILVHYGFVQSIMENLLCSFDFLVWSFVCLLVVVLVLRYLFVCVSVKRPKIKAWLLTSWILWCNCSNENSLE